ncbi:MAG: hypothetical protein LBL66_02250 [Clostridiales bacterium]|jgi:hypothetical protein|nr:hypothetical protein [Clostridiales bacterium]
MINKRLTLRSTSQRQKIAAHVESGAAIFYAQFSNENYGVDRRESGARQRRLQRYFGKDISKKNGVQPLTKRISYDIIRTISKRLTFQSTSQRQKIAAQIEDRAAIFLCAILE